MADACPDPRIAGPSRVEAFMDKPTISLIRSKCYVDGQWTGEPTLLKLAYSYEQAAHHRIPPKLTPGL